MLFPLANSKRVPSVSTPPDCAAPKEIPGRIDDHPGDRQFGNIDGGQDAKGAASLGQFEDRAIKGGAVKVAGRVHDQIGIRTVRSG